MKTALRIEACRLRREQGKSIKQIAQLLEVSPSSVSIWVRGIALTDDQHVLLDQQNPAVNGALRSRKRKDRGEESKYHRLCPIAHIDRVKRARIAEAAVLFRLVLNGFDPYGTAFDGEKYDWIVAVPETGKLVTLQVKWASRRKQGLPFIKLRCSDGRGKSRSYRKGEFDFIVGYDLFTDTAYIFKYEDVINKRVISIRPAAAERWDLLR